MPRREKLTTRREAGRIFDLLHHPDSVTRQLADWYGGDPANPPPKVREAIAEFQKVSMEATRQIAPKPRKRLRAPR